MIECALGADWNFDFWLGVISKTPGFAPPAKKCHPGCLWLLAECWLWVLVQVLLSIYIVLHELWFECWEVLVDGVLIGCPLNFELWLVRWLSKILSVDAERWLAQFKLSFASLLIKCRLFIGWVVECWVLDIEPWVLSVECWVLSIDCWVLRMNVEYWVLSI